MRCEPMMVNVLHSHCRNKVQKDERQVFMQVSNSQSRNI